jgi:hypothetical protein
MTWRKEDPRRSRHVRRAGFPIALAATLGYMGRTGLPQMPAGSVGYLYLPGLAVTPASISTRRGSARIA